MHDAFETMSCRLGSYVSKLTPSTTVTSGSFAGAETITFFAPASRCLAASARARKRPVDSITTSTPSSSHGSRAGSLSIGVTISAAVDDDRSVDRLDRAGEAAVDGVVLEQLGEHRRIGDVVDRDPLDVGARLERGPERGATGPPEAVDCDADSHVFLLCSKFAPTVEARRASTHRRIA